MMKRRRLLITGVLLLLGGAIVNVAVAWGFGAATDITLMDARNPTSDEHDWFRTLLGSNIYSESSGELRSNSGMTYLYVDGINACSQGWPIRSLNGTSGPYFTEGQFHRGSLGLWEYRYFRRPIHRNPDFNRLTLIAFMPLWPGFAINTIFYAAMLWVVFFVPGMVRRRIRRRRGLCPACAYPIGTSPVCTECGAAVKRS